jgi:myxalamid-type polyketide synthase MxaE and MxaD
LRDGVDLIREVPSSRWNVDDFYDPDHSTPGKMNTRWGSFLDDVERFDAAFFRVSPREATDMDPQQRLTLELAWEALEAAGIPPTSLNGSPTGTFIGVANSDFAVMFGSDADAIHLHTGSGHNSSIIANRVSYFLGLQGPSLIVNTACSSSLVAVHLACHSLRSGESALALAGAVNLVLAPASTVQAAKAGVMASDGRCKTFDARADGYVRGEGAAVVVLKTLSQALTDGDRIYGLVRGSAVNNDGQSNGISAPNRQAQEALLRSAYASAGIDPLAVDYVEAHGTGTMLGDTTEAAALGAVLGEARPPDRPLLVGSCKTNIGHLEAAAGMAGLIKATLAVKSRTIPAHLHFEQPNPRIPFDELKLEIPTKLRPWPDHPGPAIAGVSSFGFGGTNCHVVVQEFRAQDWPALEPQTGQASPVAGGAGPGEADHGPLLVPLSARSGPALRGVARQTLAWARSPDHRLIDLAFTAGSRRSHLEHRLAIVAGSPAELLTELEAAARGEESPQAVTGRTIGRRGRRAFVFSGQGPKLRGSGRELLLSEPVFREVVERCDATIRQVAGWSLLDEMCVDESYARLDHPSIAQPVVFALQVGLAALWQSWGIVPDAVIGHSLGEVAAATVAGALSLENGARVALHRGRIQQQASGRGKMAAVDLSPVGLSPADLIAMVGEYGGEVSVAAINGPRALVLTGAAKPLEELVASLRLTGAFCGWLGVDFASHGPQMRPLRDQLVDSLQSIEPTPATMPIYSTVKGRPLEGSELTAAYWGSNICEPVRFMSTLHTMADAGFAEWLEIGPHPSLGPAIRSCLAEWEASGLVLFSLSRDRGERVSLRHNLAALYVAGCPVDWNRVNPRGHHVVLPSYPWQRERYWPDQPLASKTRTPVFQTGLPRYEHPLLGRRIRSPIVKDILFQADLSPRSVSILADHRVADQTVMPGAGLIEMALAAASTRASGPIALEDVAFPQPLVLDESGSCTVQVIVESDNLCGDAFRILHLESNTAEPAWALLSSGRVTPVAAKEEPESYSLGVLQALCSREISSEQLYQSLEARGYDYGPSLRLVRRLWLGESEGLAEIRLPEAMSASDSSYQLHPALVDACFQTAFAGPVVFGAPAPNGESVLMPFAIDTIRRFRPLPNRIWCYAQQRMDPSAPDAQIADIYLLDADGRSLATLTGIRARRRRVGMAREKPLRRLPPSYYRIAWRPRFAVDLPPHVTESRPIDRWLILGDWRGLGDVLAERLRGRGCVVDIVRAREASGAHPRQGEIDQRIVVDPADPDAFGRLDAIPFASLRGVVYLWGLDAAPGDDGTNDWAAALRPLCTGLLHLVQSLIRSGATTTRLWIVTRGAQVVDPTMDSPVLAQAPLWGLGAAVAQEHPSLRCSRLDLDPRPSPSDADRIVREILDESPEDSIAIRNGTRFVARLVFFDQMEPDSPDLPFSKAGTASPICSNATYLITGGLGALGLEVARWLAASGARHLVLAGRSLPTTAANEVIAGIASRGVDVVVESADVGQLVDLERIVHRIGASLPPLRGVVHAAGVLDDGMLSEQTWTRFWSVFAPKVAGAWNLHQATRDLPLDFFILFSSMVALFGAPGQANHAASNAFLDALAHWRRVQKTVATSINWGPWASVGSAARLADEYRRLWGSRGVGEIGLDDGARVFGELFSWKPTQVAVIPADWPTYFRQLPAGVVPPMFEEIERVVVVTRDEAAEPTNLIVEFGRLSPSDRRVALRDRVRRACAKVLGIASPTRIQTDQVFSDLGFDSLMALEVRNVLGQSLGRPLKATMMFDYPTVDAVVEHLDQLLFSTELASPLPELRTNGTFAEDTLATLERLTDGEVQLRLVKSGIEGAPA